LRSEMNTMREDILVYIDLRLEQLVHDFNGIFHDRTVQHDEKIENHETRIARVEHCLSIGV